MNIDAAIAPAWSVSCTRDLQLISGGQRFGYPTCKLNRTFGCTSDDANLWVSSGCWASFTVPGALKPVSCGHSLFRRVRNATPWTYRYECPLLWPWPSERAPALVRERATRLLRPGEAVADLLRAEMAVLNLHGHALRMHAARGDVMLPRLAQEFGAGERRGYNLHRLRPRRPNSIAANASINASTYAGRSPAATTSSRVVVDIGCNLGDFTIAAWKTNPHLQILCLEPMSRQFDRRTPPLPLSFLVYSDSHLSIKL